MVYRGWVTGLGFMEQGLGLRAWLGLKAWDSGFRVKDFMFGI